MKINRKGQTLIEAVVALGIILLVISSITVLIVASLYNSQFIKAQNLANKYSQQGMEFVRNYQKNSLDKFSSTTQTPTGTYCIVGSTLSPCAVPQTLGSGSHDRIINLARDASPCATGETRVTVVTRWTSSKCGTNTFCHKSEVTSCLPNVANSAP